MKQLLPDARLPMTALAAIILSSPAAMAADPAEGVSVTREPFLEISWEHVNASRYDVRIGERPVMGGTRLNYLHDGETVPDDLVVEAVRFEGSISDPARQEIREPLEFEVSEVERYVIDWDPDVYDRPYIGFHGGYEGPVTSRGWQTHLAQRRPFRIEADPEAVQQVLFGAGVETEDGRMTAPFSLTRSGIEKRGEYRELELP
jgi:hypothetical protein